jgi:hypothetical protein
MGFKGLVTARLNCHTLQLFFADSSSVLYSLLVNHVAGLCLLLKLDLTFWLSRVKDLGEERWS